MLSVYQGLVLADVSCCVLVIIILRIIVHTICSVWICCSIPHCSSVSQLHVYSPWVHIFVLTFVSLTRCKILLPNCELCDFGCQWTITDLKLTAGLLEVVKQCHGSLEYQQVAKRMSESMQILFAAACVEILHDCTNFRRLRLNRRDISPAKICKYKYGVIELVLANLGTIL